MYLVDGTTVPAARCEAGGATADVVPAHDVAVLEGRGERGPRETAEIKLEEMGVQGRRRRSWTLRWTTTLAAAAETTRLPRTAMDRL